jgi:hypothetical protein
MKRLVLSLALALSLVPSLAAAQVEVNVHLGLPAAPQLVVVQPGVQVVEDFHEEVFFTNGWYWMRRDGRWWRARTPNATFVSCEPRRVPAALVRIPPGHYKHWRHEEAKAERREWKHHEKEERRAWKEHERAERREERGERHEREHEHEREHGHGHGHD